MIWIFYVVFTFLHWLRKAKLFIPSTAILIFSFSIGEFELGFIVLFLGGCESLLFPTQGLLRFALLIISCFFYGFIFLNGQTRFIAGTFTGRARGIVFIRFFEGVFALLGRIEIYS